MNKTLLSLIVAISTISFGFAQVDQTIKSEFNTYQQLIQKGQFEASLDYIYPKLFEVLPKEKMLQVMQTMTNNPMLEMEFGESKVLETTEPKEVNGEYYSIIRFRSTIRMKAKSGNMNEGKKRMIENRMRTAFEEQFGAENVSFDKASGFFIISPEKDAVAISSNGKTDWKFITIEENQKLLMKKVLPEGILEQLNQ